MWHLFFVETKPLSPLSLTLSILCSSHSLKLFFFSLTPSLCLFLSSSPLHGSFTLRFMTIVTNNKKVQLFCVFPYFWMGILVSYLFFFVEILCWVDVKKVTTFIVMFHFCSYFLLFCLLLPSLIKKFIFLANFVWKIFSYELFANFVVKKKICRKLLPIFLQNILYKTLFATNFVENTCKFYNFVGNDYPRKNYLPIKNLRKNGRKKSILANFFIKFAKKILCNMRISSSAYLTTPFCCIYL